jgi:hypothetical protein
MLISIIHANQILAWVCAWKYRSDNSRYGISPNLSFHHLWILCHSHYRHPERWVTESATASRWSPSARSLQAKSSRQPTAIRMLHGRIDGGNFVRNMGFGATVRSASEKRNKVQRLHQRETCQTSVRPSDTDYISMVLAAPIVMIRERLACDSGGRYVHSAVL